MTEISDDTPAYNEQAIFTPDMKTVIMMSNRSSPQSSWYDLIVSAAMRTGFDAPNTGSTQTLQFLSDFIGSDFNSNLYAVDVRTKAIRQLTDFANAVVPEFYWNHDYSKIIVGVETKGVNDVDLPTWIGQFDGVSNSERQVSKQIPAPGLEGTPVNMARVGSQAQAISDPGPTDNVSVRVPLPSTRRRGRASRDGAKRYLDRARSGGDLPGAVAERSQLRSPTCPDSPSRPHRFWGRSVSSANEEETSERGDGGFVRFRVGA